MDLRQVGRSFLTVMLLWIGGCILQTETVPGPKGSRGEPGDAGAPGKDWPQGPSGAAGDIPTGIISMWSGSLAAIPAGWVLCDGSTGTPDLRDRFVRGAAEGAEPGESGGGEPLALTTTELPTHSHSGSTDEPTNSTHIHDGATEPSYAWNNCIVYGPSNSAEVFPLTWGGSYIGGNCSFHDGTLHSHTFQTGPAKSDVHTHAFTTSVMGQGAPFAVPAPPFFALAFIMKL